MARRKRKDEPTDWVAPDFDEVGYMRTEIQAAKTAVLTIAWAAVGAIVSFLLYSVNAALAFFAGIGVAFGLYYVLPYLGIAVKGFKRRDWTGHGITYFFSWLAFWILLLNPPFGDFTTPTIQAISVSPVHTGYTGYLSCLPLVGGAVTVPLTIGTTPCMSCSARPTTSASPRCKSTSHPADPPSLRSSRRRRPYSASAVVELTRPRCIPAGPIPWCSSSLHPPTGSRSPPATRAVTPRATRSTSAASESDATSPTGIACRRGASTPRHVWTAGPRPRNGC